MGWTRHGSYEKGASVTQAEKAVNMLMSARSQKDLNFAEQSLDACVSRAAERAETADRAQIRDLCLDALNNNPHDNFHDLRANILQRNAGRINTVHS